MEWGAARFGRARGDLRVGVDVTAGDVKRGEGGFGILREPAAAGLDQARDWAAGACRASLAQHLGAATQLARQYDQRAIDVDPRTIDLDRPGNPELRGR